MSDETTTTTVSPPHGRHRYGRIAEWLHEQFWIRIPVKYRHNIWPEVDFLPGEEVQLEVYLAWYRDITSTLVFGYFFWLIGVVLVGTALLFALNQNMYLALIPLILLVLLIIEGIREYLDYNQWRLIKTNKRLIISLPQHGSWPLVDTISLGTVPKVIDANWSSSFVWRVFQFFTGARDVYISLAAIQFQAGTAVVKDALVFPDVMPDDVFKLKELVFS